MNSVQVSRETPAPKAAAQTNSAHLPQAPSPDSAGKRAGDCRCPVDGPGSPSQLEDRSLQSCAPRRSVRSVEQELDDWSGAPSRASSSIGGAGSCGAAQPCARHARMLVQLVFAGALEVADHHVNSPESRARRLHPQARRSSRPNGRKTSYSSVNWRRGLYRRVHAGRIQESLVSARSRAARERRQLDPHAAPPQGPPTPRRRDRSRRCAGSCSGWMLMLNPPEAFSLKRPLNAVRFRYIGMAASAGG